MSAAKKLVDLLEIIDLPPEDMIRELTTIGQQALAEPDFNTVVRCFEEIEKIADYLG